MADEKEVMHSVPCTQKDNISHLTKQVDRLFEIIEGNGKPGMKHDLALAVDHLSQIKDKLSSATEIQNELEVQRRIKVALDNFKKERRAKSIKRIEIILAIIAGLSGTFVVVLKVLES